jgi:hypothetical protein
LTTAAGSVAVGGVDADCELRDDWFLAQDVNAWTSLAYVAAGVLIVVTAARRRLPGAFHALGALAILEGVGSFLFHGGSGDLAQYAHDVPIAGVLGMMAGWHVGRVSGPGVAARWSLVGAVAGVVAGTVASATGTIAAMAATLVATIVAAELVARSRGLPTLWTLPVTVVAAVGATAWLAGTAGSPLCAEQSVLQLHGAWHASSAALLVVWVESAASARSERSSAGRVGRRSGVS